MFVELPWALFSCLGTCTPSTRIILSFSFMLCLVLLCYCWSTLLAGCRHRVSQGGILQLLACIARPSRPTAKGLTQLFRRQIRPRSLEGFPCLLMGSASIAGGKWIVLAPFNIRDAKTSREDYYIRLFSTDDEAKTCGQKKKTARFAVLVCGTSSLRSSICCRSSSDIPANLY